ncbi:uncharacterized protein LOC116928832 isoform X1 [Daphnia magna]|uniref:Putative Hemicentin-1 n=1 Tax=Daphnia magna TaxID=35525 RepID=A0A0N8DC87_9CRUS|nr:uncharacterized protein LOC116928832 isoform X1 [Daphnia magna]XP_032791842.1 uncharacterized protein LOC116928832 isoform X1 [Daphnia magna]XP_032791847.1 uncharacterized protein LOC116928832 isoform X1 [Daphnia magna]XP_032791848.1 uncharacterized protein LOC116928832 isoform X1 [Daphnia magna]KZS09637.1 putative Hemicentin-1 [Daphnia magna]
MNQRFQIRRLFTMQWLLMALAFLLVATASNRERSGTHQQFVRNNHHHRRNGNSTSRNAGGKRAAVQVTSPVPDSSPYLASDNAPPKTIISVQTSLNGNIFMHCPVDMTEDFQVSWVRLPDWRIVASGRNIYNKDERFRVLHVEGTDEWTLQIKYAALVDQGLYECQVSTETGIMIYYYNVSVIVPDTSIIGGSEYHVDMGSAIQLTCIIRNIPQEPQFVFWYHNDRMINYDSITDSSGSKTAMDDASSSSPSSSRTKARARPRVEVVTEIESNSMTNDGEQREGAADRSVTSQLTIRHVTDVDSGNYTCAPSNAEPASTMVYVSEGDDAAAAIQVSVGETTNVSDVVPANSAVSAASSPISTASAATSSVTSSLAVLVFCCLTLANCHIGRR